MYPKLERRLYLPLGLVLALGTLSACNRSGNTTTTAARTDATAVISEENVDPRPLHPPKKDSVAAQRAEKKAEIARTNVDVPPPPPLGIVPVTTLPRIASTGDSEGQEDPFDAPPGRAIKTAQRSENQPVAISTTHSDSRNSNHHAADLGRNGSRAGHTAARSRSDRNPQFTNQQVSSQRMGSPHDAETQDGELKAGHSTARPGSQSTPARIASTRQILADRERMMQETTPEQRRQLYREQEVTAQQLVLERAAHQAQLRNARLTARRWQNAQNFGVRGGGGPVIRKQPSQAIPVWPTLAGATGLK